MFLIPIKAVTARGIGIRRIPNESSNHAKNGSIFIIRLRFIFFPIARNSFSLSIYAPIGIGLAIPVGPTNRYRIQLIINNILYSLPYLRKMIVDTRFGIHPVKLHTIVASQASDADMIMLLKYVILSSYMTTAILHFTITYDAIRQTKRIICPTVFRVSLPNCWELCSSLFSFEFRYAASKYITATISNPGTKPRILQIVFEVSNPSMYIPDKTSACPARKKQKGVSIIAPCNKDDISVS